MVERFATIRICFGYHRLSGRPPAHSYTTDKHLAEFQIESPILGGDHASGRWSSHASHFFNPAGSVKPDSLDDAKWVSPERTKRAALGNG